MTKVEDWLRPHVEYIMNVYWPLLKRDDRKGLIAALHAKERENVINHKLGKIWQPTPFPLEEMA